MAHGDQDQLLGGVLRRRDPLQAPRPLMSIEELYRLVKRFHVRATIAFLILALGGIAGFALERHDSSSASQGNRRTQADQAHNICVAVNEIRREAQHFVIKLAPDTPVPKDAGAPLRSTIERSNRLKKTLRDEARDSFKIARCP